MKEPLPSLAAVYDPTEGPHLVGELGLHIDRNGEHPSGTGEVLAEACIPGTDLLRTSVLATWSDILAGAAAGHATSPRIPLTLDLEIQVVAPVRVGTTVTVEARVVRSGRSVTVTGARFTDAASGALLAESLATFVSSPDPTAVFPDGFPSVVLDGRLAVPLAERLGTRIVEPGIVEAPRTADGLNAVGAMQGGLLAVAAEDAASSWSAEPVVADSIVVRYLRPIMVGPARAVATGEAPGLCVVELSDAGTGKLGIVATVRTRLAAG